jgi:hypothetical protein
MIKNNRFVSVHRGVGSHSGETGRYFDRIAVTGNTFRNVVGYAVRATNWRKSIISKNKIENCGSGIFFNHITDNYQNYYPVSGGKRTTKLNSKIENNTITVGKTAFQNLRYGIRIYGEKLSSNKKAGKYVIPKGDYRIQGMKVRGNKITMKTEGNGMMINGLYASEISRNTITASAKAGRTVYGIRLSSQTSKLKIQSNTIRDKKKMFRYGIYEEYKSSGTTMKKNSISGVRDAGIRRA